MTLLRSYEDLDAWKAAHEFTLAVYRATDCFPRTEMFGIVAQLRRGAASVPANLAEGFGRRSTKELLRYCRISDGSLQETKYFLRLAKDLGYCDSDRYATLESKANRVGALLGGLANHLSSRTKVKARDPEERNNRSTDQRINRSTEQ